MFCFKELKHVETGPMSELIIKGGDLYQPKVLLLKKTLRNYRKVRHKFESMFSILAKRIP